MWEQRTNGYIVVDGFPPWSCAQYKSFARLSTCGCSAA